MASGEPRRYGLDVSRSFEVARRGSSRLLVAAPALLLLLYGVTPGRTSGFREDEVQCEEAKAHVLDCCDPFTGHLECEFEDRGCGVTYPDLEVAESRSLRGQSCDEIRRHGTCQKNFAEMP